MKNKLIKHIKENVVGYACGIYSLALLSLPVIDYVDQGKRTGEWNISKQSSECFKNTIAIIGAPEILMMKQIGDHAKDTANYYINWNRMPCLKNDTSKYYVDSWGKHRLVHTKRQYVMSHLDKNRDGRLNFNEKFNLYRLAEKDPDNYLLQSKDWERAYNKIKNQEAQADSAR